MGNSPSVPGGVASKMEWVKKKKITTFVQVTEDMKDCTNLGYWYNQ
jgi:hypothetical protein